MVDTLGIATKIIEKATKLGLTITTAESCTGGMVSAALTDPAGASSVFERGFVTYSNRAKADLLHVPEEIFETVGAVSEQCAKAMAEGARSTTQADIAVAVTGIAGPGGSDHKPEGLVCFAIASKRGTRMETIKFGANGRAENRKRATHHALHIILAELETLNN